MKVLHHGAVSGVTGSCHQLIVDAQNSVLVDCGLFQGVETAGGSGADQLEIRFDISTVKALLVTHCHIDHVGRIPYLLAAGFTGPIIGTEATAALLPLVIEDALKVGVTRNRSIIQACLKRLSAQLIAVPYRSWHALTLSAGASAKIRFQPAGHILGSAYIEVDAASADVKKRVVFSGDLGATYAPLLPSPKAPYAADTLVIESTYGDRIHDKRKHRSKVLKDILAKAIADHGIVIIPAFSIGRTQELLYELEHMIGRAHPGSRLADIEVIVDSPMAAKFTEYYRRFKSLWDAEARQRLEQGRHPLDFSSLYTVGSHQEHMQVVDYLARRKKPAIVIAASGMCTGGRVVNYLKRFLDDATTDVIFVGYQARGTLGRKLQEMGEHWQKPKKHIVIDGKKIALNAAIHTISGYSAHADQANLVNFVKRMKKRPQEVIVVHGDVAAKQALVEKLAPLVARVRVGL